MALDRRDAIAIDATVWVAALENDTSVFEAWRPRIEGSFETIKSLVNHVKAELINVTLLLERAAVEEPTSHVGVFVGVKYRQHTTESTA
jgi:hypothetical protein